MHNTSLSGLLRGVQSRHDDCGISWESHKMKEINDNNKSISHLKKIVDYLEDMFQRQRNDEIKYIKRVAESARFDQNHLVKWGSPPFQYRNPRIDGPVVGQDDMEQRKEWLDTIARESERLGLD